MPCPIHSIESVESLVAYGSKADDGRVRRWKNFEGRRQPFYGPYSRKARQMRESVAEAGLEVIRTTRSVDLMEPGVQAAFRRDDVQEPVRAFLRDSFRTVGRAFAQHAFQQHKSEHKAGSPEDAWFQQVAQWLTSGEGGAEIRQITETVRSDIMGLLASAREDGVGAEEMARRIEEQIEEIHRQRARVIARTEVITASNWASQIGAQEAAQSMQKEWVDSGDSRVRLSHREVDGQTRALDEPYDVRGFPARFPADPQLPARERIQCRCIEVYTRDSQREAFA